MDDGKYAWIVKELRVELYSTGSGILERHAGHVWYSVNFGPFASCES
jgi:hypothetical protein